MGEAKRKQAQGRQAVDGLRRRLAAGDFGPAGAAGRYLLVLDKSPAGTELLAALRADPLLPGLAPLLDGEALAFWQASALFRFVVLCGGAGTADQRTLLAADLPRLLQTTLPRALARFAADARPGVELAVAGADRAAIERLLGSAEPAARVDRP